MLDATTQDSMALLTGFSAGRTIEVILEAANGNATSQPSDRGALATEPPLCFFA